MFNKITVAFLFCSISTIANAQDSKLFHTSKPVLCDETRVMMGALMQEWQEVPVWKGVDAKDDTRYVLMINTSKGNWSLIQYTPEYACLLGAGDRSDLKAPNKNAM